MSITRIAPEDFVFNNDLTSNSCWVDANNDFVESTKGIKNITRTVTMGTAAVKIFDWFLDGVPSNLQFSSTIANSTTPGYEAIYGAIRNILYGDKNATIQFDGVGVRGFTVISINRYRYKNALLPGSLNLGNLYTDDSNQNLPTILNCGRVYNIGKAKTDSYGNVLYGYTAGGDPVGLLLPDVGLILLADTSGFFESFLASRFILSYEDYTPTNHVFIRARNTEYNYSTNPSFISGNSGIIINQDWFSNPQTYITTVGLYNDNNELMATAKLPRPYNKNFNNELLIQVGLNF